MNLRVKPPPPRQQPKAKGFRSMLLIGGAIIIVMLALVIVWMIIKSVAVPTRDHSERVIQPSQRDAPSADFKDALRASEQLPVRSIAQGSEGGHFTCSVVKVHDGDGPVWCSEGERVRLAGIAAREIDESCRKNQPCPSASGASAQMALQRLVLGKLLSCQQVGTSYNRTVAWCRLPNSEDVSCEMIKTGTALRWERYDPDRRLIGC